MKYLDVLRAELESEIKNAERNLKEARNTRDNAASAMESQHDMTRARAESEIHMYEEKIRNLTKSIDKIPAENPKCKEVGLWCLTKIELPEATMKIVIVPENMGGKKVGEIHYISKVTPLGKSIMKKKVGENFSFSNQAGEIISIA